MKKSIARVQVCLMLFTDPRTLPCGNSHNVCLECAKGLWKNQESSYIQGVPCPVCRAPCHVNGGVDRLPVRLPARVATRQPFVRRDWAQPQCQRFVRDTPVHLAA